MSGQDRSEPLIARSEAHAALGAIVALARAGDDVLSVGAPPEWLAGVCEVARTRARSASQAELFDAIGEHTAALLVTAPSDDLLEALVELGPPVICLGAGGAHASLTIVCTAPDRFEVSLGTLDASRAEALTRALAALAS